MPSSHRLSLLMTFTALSLTGQEPATFVPVGDNGAWLTVGAVLTGVCYGCVKVLDRLQQRK